MSIDVVIPTVHRPSLPLLLNDLARQRFDLGTIYVVDDRPLPNPGPVVRITEALRDRVRVMRSGSRGPAAARNVGWRASSAEWISFLDDDVRLAASWVQDLRRDLESARPHVGGVQGMVRVPLPCGRAPTDWERNVSGLADAKWITADMAYRRAVLERVNGFDERFARAYREDADLALRVKVAGFFLEAGSRCVDHPIVPSGFWKSVSLQAGNADDVLMRRLHGPHWRHRGEIPEGRRPAHIAVTALGILALIAAGLRLRPLALSLAAACLAGIGELTGRRIARGPRTSDEILRMVATSVALPWAATWHWLRGLWRWRGALPWGEAA